MPCLFPCGAPLGVKSGKLRDFVQIVILGLGALSEWAAGSSDRCATFYDGQDQPGKSSGRSDSVRSAQAKGAPQGNRQGNIIAL